MCSAEPAFSGCVSLGTHSGGFRVFETIYMVFTVARVGGLFWVDSVDLCWKGDEC